jgi:phosphoribosylamine--glycine ligase
MNLFVLGSGGREHALVWKFVRDGHKVTCAPGNAGIAQIAECVQVNLDDNKALAEYAARNRFDLTVVGPEAPLVNGVADEFRPRGLPLFGPTRAGAQLEGSKAFAKGLMQEHGIPTARFETFTDAAQALAYVQSHDYPLVIKASGLAAGKGAVIVQNRDEARLTIEQMLTDEAFGPAGATVVIEDFLVGEEASIIAITDGRAIACLAPSQDHKALLDGDQGPNTGGMGAYAPAPVVTPEVQHAVEQMIFAPLLKGLQAKGIEYQGIIYAGIMMTARGPSVLEFNCRFGDPETQVILPQLKTDLAKLLLAAVQGRLAGVPLVNLPGSVLCVVAASAGYPGSYEKGRLIAGDLSDAADTMVFHAGTARRDGQLVTSGGRVLGVTARADSLPQAKAKAYARLKHISFPGMTYRSDIGDKGIRRN